MILRHCLFYCKKYLIKQSFSSDITNFLIELRLKIPSISMWDKNNLTLVNQPRWPDQLTSYE